MDDASKHGTSLARTGVGIAIVAIVAIALLFRIVGLGHLPGLNGDEAWYGVLAQSIAAGAEPSWRTPTGNLPGPFQLGSLLILQSIFPPSFALLRVPAVLSSIAAASLAWWLVRRHFGGPAGSIALILMAALPVNIAYARLGWDPSHVPLIGLIAAAFALANRPTACAAAFAVAMAAHPTSIFILPFLALCLLGAAKERDGWRPALVRTGMTAGGLLLIALAMLMIITSGGNATARPSDVLTRMIDPRQWAAFALLYGRLLTGQTVYQYVVGTDFGRARELIDFATILLLAGMTAYGLSSLIRRPFGREAGVVAGWLATLLGFFLIAGNGAITPQFERYALCLIGPTVIALAVLVRELGGREARLLFPLGISASLAMLLLAGFGQFYVRALEMNGGLAHRTFQTGSVEPKQAAFDAIQAEAAGRPTRVIAEDWWLYWPIAYLAADKPIAVTDLSATTPHAAMAAGRLWLTFAGSTVDRRLAATPGAVLSKTIAGTGRPALLHLWRTGPPLSRFH